MDTIRGFDFQLAYYQNKPFTHEPASYHIEFREVHLSDGYVCIGENMKFDINATPEIEAIVARGNKNIVCPRNYIDTATAKRILAENGINHIVACNPLRAGDGKLVSWQEA